MSTPTAPTEDTEEPDRSEVRRRIERALDGTEPTHDAFQVVSDVRRKLAARYAK